MGAAALALAAVIGFSLGLLGGGGSILVVPALTFLMGFDAKQAVVTSLAAVGLAAAVGAAFRSARGRLPLVPALIIGSMTMVGAYGGARIGSRLADSTQLTILGGVMVAAAAIMLADSRRRRGEAAMPGAVRPIVLGVAGAGVGVLTGLVGVGGGFLIVPALVIGGGLSMPAASGASLLAIALASAAGLAGYAGRVPLAWGFVLPFAAVASVGTIAGGLLAERLPQHRLQQVFAAVLIGIALFTLSRR